MQRKQDRAFLDMLQAKQTSDIIAALAGVDIKPDQCMAFEWDEPEPEHEMTEDEMDTFDRTMDSWVLATREKFKNV
jgi:hypothetical protein